MDINVNYLALLLAVVGYMVVGFLWYSPLLFAKPWIRLMGFSATQMKADQKKMGVQYTISAVLGLVTAYVLNHVMVLSMHFFGTTLIQSGLSTAFFMWLGFIMPVQATSVLFSGKKVDSDAWMLFGINTGYQLVSLFVMALIIGFLG